MWLITRQVPEWEDSFLLTLGKALALCQNFETNCKTALMWMDLVTALKASEVSLSDEKKLGDFVEKLMNRMLGQNIRILEKEYGITKKSIAVLKAAETPGIS